MTPTIDHSKALGAVRYLRSLVVSKENPEAAAGWIAGQNWRNTDALLELVTRSGVSAADDADLRGRNPVLTDLAGQVRAASVLGQLPGVVELPWMAATVGLSGAARAVWVRQGVAVPASAITLGEPGLLDEHLVGALLIARDQFLRQAGPLAEKALAAELIAATAEAFDNALLDVANTGSGDAPASITSTGYSTASTGSTLSAIDTDLGGLVEELSGEDLASARWVLHPRTAAYLARLRGTGGALAYPGIGVNGGEILGIPAVVSKGVPMDADTAAETQISLIVGSGVAMAGGEVELRTSKQAAIEMDTQPTGDAGTPTAQSAYMVSMFQSNCTALMTLGHINWRARRSTVAATLTAVGF